jgi:putative DNA primase/helicase
MDIIAGASARNRRAGNPPLAGAPPGVSGGAGPRPHYSGVLYVSASEVQDGQRFSEGLVKQLTGGDRIKARFLFQEYFEFVPQFKLFLACNYKPIVRGTDLAIWERIKLVPFTVTIPPAERDTDPGTKLRAELEGMFAWAVRGCLAWQREGLGTPPEVTQATRAYQAEMDV